MRKTYREAFLEKMGNSSHKKYLNANARGDRYVNDRGQLTGDRIYSGT